jgi:hypothetical protein
VKKWSLSARYQLPSGKTALYDYFFNEEPSDLQIKAVEHLSMDYFMRQIDEGTILWKQIAFKLTAPKKAAQLRKKKR